MSKPTTWLVAALAAALSWPAAAQAQSSDQPGVINEQAPVQLQWSLTGDLAAPGGLGVRGRVNAWAPGLPIYVGAGAERFKGLSPAHLAGERDGFLTRQLMSLSAFEVRAGLSLESWDTEQEDTTYAFDTKYFGNTTTWKEATYRPTLPVYFRRSLYVGYRKRSVPGYDNCPDVDEALLADDCGEGATFAMVGYSSFRGLSATFLTQSHGRLRKSFYRHLDLRATYAFGDHYGRDSLANKLGAELVMTYGRRWFTFGWSAGWDGQVALLSVFFGGGGQHSFVGSPR